jgi:putative transposase
MSTQRKQYSAEFKARVALEALKGFKTVNELASTYGVHPTQIAHWKHRLHKEMSEIFSVRRDKREREQEALQAQLYQQIGQLMELDWVKKRWTYHDAKRGLIEPGHLQISIARQCELWGAYGRLTHYHATGESPENLHLMRLLMSGIRTRRIMVCAV